MTMIMRRKIKIFCAHIEWGTASMFIGLGALVVALAANSWPVWAFVSVASAVLVLGCFAAHGAHTQRSIDRIMQFDRDFKNLKTERKIAAKHLLNKDGKIDDVLDFFDTPIGNLTARGYLDEKLVYEFFFEWIRGYWSACREYVERQEDGTKWSNFKTLYRAVIEIHKNEPDSDKKELLAGDELREFLEWELE